MKLYMGVTPDKYELPLYVAETAEELAKMVGTNRATVYSSITHKASGRDRGVKLIKIIIDEEKEWYLEN